jgi:small subunit ribosomal protein S21
MTNLKIIPERYESLDDLMRRLKRATVRSGIMAELKRVEGFRPRAERRKIKSHKARARKAKHDAT